MLFPVDLLILHDKTYLSTLQKTYMTSLQIYITYMTSLDEYSKRSDILCKQLYAMP